MNTTEINSDVENCQSIPSPVSKPTKCKLKHDQVLRPSLTIFGCALFIFSHQKNKQL